MLLACGLVFAGGAFALELELPSIFADKMVLQRDRPVPVWGTAEAGTAVTVEFAGQTQTAVADADGKWRVDLKPMIASAESRVLKVIANHQSAILRRSRRRGVVCGRAVKYVSPVPDADVSGGRSDL